MRPQDIEQLLQVGAPALAPDGSVVLAAVTHPDLDADATVGQLWRVALPDGGPQRLTRGFRDTRPRFSPSGTAVAFLRATRTTPPQLVVMPASGGEPMPITDAPLGVEDFAWSPSGEAIAFIARDPEPGRYGTVDGLGAGAEPPRRFTTLKYRANGDGYITDKPARLWLVEVPDLVAAPVPEPAPTPDGPAEPHPVPAARRLSTVDADLSSPAFTADGDAVLVLGSLHDSRDADLVTDVWRIGIRSDGVETPDRVTDGSGDVECFAVDGDRLWTIGVDLGPSRTDFIGRGGALTLWQGGGSRRLTDPEHVDLGDGPAPVPTGNGGVLAVRRSRGAADLLRIDEDGVVTQLSSGVDVGGVAAAEGRVVVSVVTPTSAGELALVDADGLRPLTGFGAGVETPALPRELEVPARDGGAVHGWVTAPAGEGPFPVLLMIHGGPFAQYGDHLFDETQVLVGAGYAVVQCNPRGSAGYGEAHARAIRGRMGTVDLTDVLDFLDGACRSDPRLDAHRVGILGGSYGGYLTAWTIAHDHRFAAAIVERGFLDPDGFVGTSDIGSFFGDEYIGADPDAMRAQSPQAVVGQVRTPVLVIHSEDDLRCPLPQGERYYAALKRQGTPAELLVFPGEDHELSRSGRPRHRVQRFEAILEWWRRYLPADASDGDG